MGVILLEKDDVEVDSQQGVNWREEGLLIRCLGTSCDTCWWIQWAAESFFFLQSAFCSFFFFFFPSAFHALFFSIKHRQYATFYGLYALLEFHLLDVLTLSPLVYRITQQDATRTPLNAFDAAAHIRPIHCRWQSLRSLSTQNVTKCCSGFFLFWIICQTWTKMETKSTLHSSKVSPQRC